MLLLISHWPNLVTLLLAAKRKVGQCDLYLRKVCVLSHTVLQSPWMKRTIDGGEVQPVVSAILSSEH